MMMIKNRESSVVSPHGSDADRPKFQIHMILLVCTYQYYCQPYNIAVCSHRLGIPFATVLHSRTHIQHTLILVVHGRTESAVLSHHHIIHSHTQHTIRPAWPRRIQYLKRLQQGKQQCPDRCRQVQTYIFLNFKYNAVLVYFTLALVGVVVAVKPFTSLRKYISFLKKTVYCIFCPFFRLPFAIRRKIGIIIIKK